jgi:hypothetical protein
MRQVRATFASRFAFGILEAGLGLVFLGAVVHHVATLDFKPLAALCLPILVAYFGFASLQYTRSRSLPKGLAQTRSLYAAERAVQATVWHLLGMVLGVSLYAFLARFGFAEGAWLALFVAPYVLMQIGLISFMRALRSIAPDFLRWVGPLELARRVQ